MSRSLSLHLLKQETASDGAVPNELLVSPRSPKPALSLSYYAPIKDNVLRARDNFKSWADSLPYPVCGVIKALSKSNKEGPLPGTMLGERDAFWLGELLQANAELQQIAAMGCIAGYTYFVHQDHRIDQDEHPVLHSELAMNLLYAKLIESFSAVAGDEHRFWHYFDRYLREFASGCLWETLDGRRRRTYSREDLRMVARRSGPAKICSSSLAVRMGKESEIPKYEAAIENVIIALQIRDDIVDCVEDFHKGRYTYPVSRLLGGREPAMISLQRAILYDSTLETLFDESTVHLLSASDILGLDKNTALRRYLDSITDENALIKESVVRAKTNLHACAGKAPNSTLPLSQGELLSWDRVHQVIRNDIQY